MAEATPSLHQAARLARYAVLDLEMTGLDLARDAICEVGLVLLDGGEVVRRWQTLVRPEVPMSAGARRVHGITDGELADAPAFREVAAELGAALERAILVGHHVQHDLAFLERAYARAGLPAPTPTCLDTLELARRLFAFRSHRLASICGALGVPIRREHRALADAEATAECFRLMLGFVDPAGRMTVRDLFAHLEAMGPQGDLRGAQLAALERALGARRSVWIEYLSRGAGGAYELSRREVEVWRVVPPRMQGFCRLRDEERVFRLERIRSVEPGERTYTIPEFRGRI